MRRFSLLLRFSVNRQTRITRKAGLVSIETELADNVNVVKWTAGEVVKVRLVDSAESAIFLVDSRAGALVVIDSIEHEVHKGHYFTSTYVNTAVGNNGTVDIRLVIGASELHFTTEVKAAGFCTIDFYEGSTLSGGTPLATTNHNRGYSDNGSDYTAYHTPVVTAVGTRLLQKIIASGSTPQTRVGGELRQTDEFVLSSNTTYLLRVTNLSGANTPVGVIISGYT